MKKQRYFILLFLALLGIQSPSYSQVDENVFRDETRKKVLSDDAPEGALDLRLDFNDEWRFFQGELPGFQDPGYTDVEWRLLELPHDWSVEGRFDPENPAGAAGAFLPTGIACYRKSFTLPESYKGKRIKIRFDGVYMNSSVYLNGVFLGTRPYGFSTFEYDLTPHLEFGDSNNVLAVKVDNSLQPSARWYTGSGINRDVHLFVTEQQHFQKFGTFIRTTKRNTHAAWLSINCKVISNNYPESEVIKFQSYPDDPVRIKKAAKIVAVLKTREGEIVAEGFEEKNLSDYSILETQLELVVTDPILWSHRNPYLYTLDLQLWVDGKLHNSQQTKTGIRVIEFNKDQGMLVNGEKVIIKGVCLHKDAGSFGTAVPKDVWRYRLRKLKRLGCNGIRTHGPVDPLFIEVCDEMGFYLMAEAFDEWEKTWQYGYSEDPAGKMPYTYHKFFRQWAETDLKAMIRRDRNHPSVVLYSVGNEMPEQRYPDGAETLGKLIKWAKEEDDTRPVIAACDWSAWANTNGFFDVMDIAGYNYPDRYFEGHYSEEHAAYPERILLGTENYMTLENWIRVRDNPYVAGLFLWVGIDYLGEALEWPRRGWEWGLMDIAGFEKSLYYYWQAFWSETPMVRIAVNLKDKDTFRWKCYNVASHWNFSPEQVDSVFVYSNTKKVELFQNGKSLGKKEVNPDTYQALYLVDYQKGELKANALQEKNVVATHSLKTAGEAKKLALISEPGEAGNEDERLIFLTLEVQDNKGIRCPFASDLISVEVQGAGELIGLDSGDQFSHEPYKQNKRKAFEGRLLLTIRPKGKGSITVLCQAENLKGTSVNIKKAKGLL